MTELSWQVGGLEPSHLTTVSFGLCHWKTRVNSSPYKAIGGREGSTKPQNAWHRAAPQLTGNIAYCLA